uniref:3-hydroxyisobutyryl-CoA hydrolase n=1 Tax=Aegilops tauschii subsp. strangulata TaxID=200361 RepID=A0A452YPX6_AEGTS
GKGRAFCAGGDVAEVAQSINNDTWKYGADFFRTEFLLNYIIATYSKPQVSLLTGIVMGGGAGVSIHGRFRVATENTVFAMPETALGLFPDIGASYFLSRLPGFYGDLFFSPTVVIQMNFTHNNASLLCTNYYMFMYCCIDFSLPC